MNNNTRVPQLRFPEFKNSGEWKKKRFIDVADKNVKWSFSGGPFGSDLKSSDYTNAGVRVIQLQNIGDGSFINKNVVYTSKNKADKLISCNIYPDEIILSKMGDPVGRASIIPNIHSRYLMCSDGIRLVVDKEHYNNYFIFSFINHPNFRKLIESSSTGSTRKRIGLGILKKLPAVLPKEKLEQQKIADCLSSLDDLITAHTEKLDTLKDHKKGLMQNLFPTDGEKVPKFRFPEFKDSDEWETIPFSKYIILYRGSSPRPIRDFITKEKTGVNWIKIGDTKYANNYIISQVVEKITTKGAEKSRKVSRGELILANSMSYGKTYLLDIEGCIYDGWFVLREYEKHFQKRFLLHILNSNFMQQQYKKLSAGGIVQNISSEIVYQTILPFTSFDEQKKITDCLSTIDEQISAQAEKIATIKQHKKGLMQGLFPTN